MITYHADRIDSSTYRIMNPEENHFMYLVEGDRLAALIDTGWGNGDIRAFAESLTRLPLIVLITHAHVDHVGGCGFFRGVFMSEEGPHDLETMRPNPFADISKLPYPNYQKVFLHEGDSVDLGGRVLEVMETKAHAVSGLMFWDRAAGLLFVGDEIMAKQVMILKHGEGDPDWRERIAVHEKTMQRLTDLLPEETVLLPGHHLSPIDTSYLQAFLELDRQILSGDYRDDLPLAEPMLERRTDAEFRRVGSGKASFIFQV